MNRFALLSSTALVRNTADAPGGAPATPVVVETPVPAAAVAPAAPVAAATVEAAPVVIAAPDPAPAPAPETVVEPAKVEAPTGDAAKPETKAAESLLESAGKPADAPKPDDATAKPGDDAATVVEPAKPTYEPFKLPENAQKDDEAISKFTEVVGAHNLPQDAAQALVDLYGERMTKFASDYAAKANEDGWRAFHDMGGKWKDQALASREFGGNGKDTALTLVAEMRDRYVSRFAPGTDEHKADWAEFDDFLRSTYGGNHPAFLRIMYNIGQERRAPSPVVAAKPPPDRGPTARGRRAAMYGDGPGSKTG